MIDLIREWLELWAKQNWLKQINRATDKYNRLNQKAKMQAYIVRALVERYNELYPNDKIKMAAREGQAK